MGAGGAPLSAVTGVSGGRPDGEYGRHRPDEYQLVECFGVDRDGPVVQFRKAERE